MTVEDSLFQHNYTGFNGGGVTHDLVQTVRPQGAKVDIGAYEAMATSGYKTYLPLTQK